MESVKGLSPPWTGFTGENFLLQIQDNLSILRKLSQVVTFFYKSKTTSHWEKTFTGMRGRRVSNDPLVGSAATKRAEYNVSKMRKAAQKSMPMSSVGNQFRERLHTFGLFFGPLPKRFHKSLLCRYQVFNFSSPPQFFGSVNIQIFPPHKVLSQIVFVVHTSGTSSP